MALGGCTSPAIRFDHLADRLGVSRERVAGDRFSHAVYFNAAARRNSSARRTRTRVRVYLAGDGRPFIERRFVNADPTPAGLTLTLLAGDPQPALLLGRPCYHGDAARPPCAPRYWTSHRYGDDVVASLEAALRALSRRGGYRELTLVGYSGGGTLAVLLAARLRSVRAVLTVAANLDLAAWTALHRHTPLYGSLDPALQPPLPDRVRRHHFGGGRDRNVPPALLRRALRGDRRARLTIVPDYDHRCCWRRDWQTLLRRFAAR